jgi:hypothetical protein
MRRRHHRASSRPVGFDSVAVRMHRDESWDAIWHAVGRIVLLVGVATAGASCRVCPQAPSDLDRIEVVPTAEVRRRQHLVPAKLEVLPAQDFAVGDLHVRIGADADVVAALLLHLDGARTNTVVLWTSGFHRAVYLGSTSRGTSTSDRFVVHAKLPLPASSTPRCLMLEVQLVDGDVARAAAAAGRDPFRDWPAFFEQTPVASRSSAVQATRLPLAVGTDAATECLPATNDEHAPAREPEGAVTEE